MSFREICNRGYSAVRQPHPHRGRYATRTDVPAGRQRGVLIQGDIMYANEVQVKLRRRRQKLSLGYTRGALLSELTGCRAPHLHSY